jgi:hypothetical protein
MRGIITLNYRPQDAQLGDTIPFLGWLGLLAENGPVAFADLYVRTLP